MGELWISTAVLTVIVLLLRRIFRGKVPYRYLYGLWLLVVLRLCVPVSIGNSPLSLSTLLNQMTPGISQEEGSTVTVQKAVTVPTDAPVIVKQKVVETDQKQWQAGKDQNDTSSQMAESSGRKALAYAGLAGWYCGHGRYTADCQHKNEPQVKKKQKTDRYYKAVWSAGL